MAENEDGQEKTEEPTQRKREKAREEGKVVSSKDAFVFVSLATGTFLIWIFQKSSSKFSGHWAVYFDIPNGADLNSLIFTNLTQAWYHFLFSCLAIAMPISMMIILLQIGIGGLNFSTNALGFKGDRINVLSGIRRMFSKQSIAELTKSVLKVSLLGVVAVSVLFTLLPSLGQIWSIDIASALSTIIRYIVLLMTAQIAVLAFIGVIDWAWQRHTMTENLMMTLKEVKDEAKDSNGNPQLKAKIRQSQIEASRRGSRERAALSNVPNANAIVSNPTHFAVALRYVPGEMSAPIVLASGQDYIAREIIRIGTTSGVQNVSSPILARALYFSTQIGMEIDERLFTAVATLLSYVFQLDRGFKGDLPDIELPDDMKFNEYGRPLSE